mmetsp:Transcript_11066/g.29713  ORF Transcript_11066/g.29713 Transcript_11066/m.29713 type:complete len:157 (+) Transcript_11066:299-769(+)
MLADAMDALGAKVGLTKRSSNRSRGSSDESLVDCDGTELEKARSSRSEQASFQRRSNTLQEFNTFKQQPKTVSATEPVEICAERRKRYPTNEDLALERNYRNLVDFGMSPPSQKSLLGQTGSLTVRPPRCGDDPFEVVTGRYQRRSFSPTLSTIYE